MVGGDAAVAIGGRDRGEHRRGLRALDQARRASIPRDGARFAVRDGALDGARDGTRPTDGGVARPTRGRGEDAEWLDQGPWENMTARAKPQPTADSRQPTHPTSSKNRSNKYTASCGPGPASGWYWTVAPGTSFNTNPSTVRSYRFTCDNSAAPKSVSQRTGSSAPMRASPLGPTTAKPWFCDVMSMRPVARSLTGWFAPR